MSGTFDALKSAVAAVERELDALYSSVALDGENDIPDDLRSKLLTMGSSINDLTFWVRQRAQEGDLGSRMYWAEEMEAGTGCWGVSAREALDNYFRDDMLDHRDHRGLRTFSRREEEAT